MATFTAGSGSIFDSGAECLVDPVNCVGVSGKGLALAFKHHFPAYEALYVAAAKQGVIAPGRPYMVRRTELFPEWICYFPTKRHWRDRSRTEDVVAGLAVLSADLRRMGVGSVAVPALGCGLGGLDWMEVEMEIRRALDPIPWLQVALYAPQ